MILKAKRKIIRLIRESWFNMLYGAFNYAPKNTKAARGLRVLVYHGICKNEALKFNARFLTEETFEQHLIAIKKCYNPLSFKDYRSGNLSSDKLNVLLTFDDGLKNNFDLALPLLLKYKIPAVFFITMSDMAYPYLFNDALDVFSVLGPEKIELEGVSFIKQKRGIHYRYVNVDGVLLSNYFHSTNEEEKNKVMKQIFDYVSPDQFSKHREYLDLLNVSEINKLAFSGLITLGTHGVSHSDFSVLNEGDLLSELKESKEKLQKITGEQCELLAFPYGNYNQATLKHSKELGYSYLFGTEKIHQEQDRALVIERFTVNPFTSAINQMYYIARQNYE